MKSLRLALAAAALAVVCLSQLAAAAWPGYAYVSTTDPNRRLFRCDLSSHSMNGLMHITYTASSDSVYFIGYIGEGLSAINVSAAFKAQPLGDPDCVVQDSQPSGTSKKTIANPRAGRPCVDWPLVDVTTSGYDFGNGGLLWLRVKGNGSAGSFDLAHVSRGQR